MRTPIAFLLVAGLVATVADAASIRRTVIIEDPIGAPESAFSRPLASTASGDLLIGTGFANGDGGAALVDPDTGAVIRTYASPGSNSFSFSASVGATGDDALIGEPDFNVEPDSPTGAFVGAVHRYDAAGTFTHTLLSPTPVNGARFGRQLAVRGNDLFVVEDGAIHRFDLTTNAFVSTFPFPAGSDPTTFANTLLALDGALVAGDPEDAQVFVLDPATGAVVRVITTPAAGSGSLFGRSLAPIGDDVLVGAPLAGVGGLVFRVALATGTVVTTWEHPLPSPQHLLGWSVASFGDMVVAGDRSFELLEDGVRDGAVFAFDATSTELVAVLGRGNLDFNHALGSSMLVVGEQLFVSAPDEDVNTVTGFRLDCGGAATCDGGDVGLHDARVDVQPSDVRVRVRLRLTATEMNAFVGDAASLCLYGTPTPPLRCTAFSCTGDNRHLDCGELGISRRGNDRARIVARVTQFLPPLPADGPLVLRFNGPPLSQHQDGTTTHGASLDRCARGSKRLRCR